MSYRPRRSVLYMPAANARALAKARTIDCDAIILDLEDAVAPTAKPAARELIAAFDEALAAGSGVATFHGRMIENLHVEAAHRTVDMFEAVRGR